MPRIVANACSSVCPIKDCGWLADVTNVRRITPDEAVARMRARGFEPTAPYPGLHAPWPCTCVAAGHHVAPTLTEVRSGCRGCAGNQPVPVEVADEVFAAAGLRRVGPYRSAHRPVECVCLGCGRALSPRVNNVRAGQGGCRSCNAKRRRQQANESVRV